MGSVVSTQVCLSRHLENPGLSLTTQTLVPIDHLGNTKQAFSCSLWHDKYCWLEYPVRRTLHFASPRCHGRWCRRDLVHTSVGFRDWKHARGGYQLHAKYLRSSMSQDRNSKQSVPAIERFVVMANLHEIVDNFAKIVDEFH